MIFFFHFSGLKIYGYIYIYKKGLKSQTSIRLSKFSERRAEYEVPNLDLPFLVH